MSSSGEEDNDRIIAEALQAAEHSGDEPPIETVVETGSPAAVIVDHAQDAQLIVVGSQGKGFLRRVLLGSVSREVLETADRPVVVIGAP